MKNKVYYMTLICCFLLHINCHSQKTGRYTTTTRTTTHTSTPRRLPVNTVTTEPTPSVSKPILNIQTTETGDFSVDMLSAVNLLRRKGCNCGGEWQPAAPPLTWNAQLQAAAMRHAKDMYDHKHFDHVGTDGAEFDTRITEAGYKWMNIGENIAVGYDNINATMQGWIKSTPHCKQLMDTKTNEMGAAKYGNYWVQDFGRQRNW